MTALLVLLTLMLNAYAGSSRCEKHVAKPVDQLDQVFRDWVWIRDVAGQVRERQVDDLKVVPIREIFDRGDEIFIGFGRPNVFITLPDGQGGYEKFAAKSVYRGRAEVVDTRGFVQSGFFLKLENLPDTAAEALRQAMDREVNKRHVTCVNASCRVLEAAGFVLGNRPMSQIVFPYQFARRLFKHPLTYKGETVSFQVYRTTHDDVESFTKNVIIAEVLAPYRYLMRALKPWSKRFGVDVVAKWLSPRTVILSWLPSKTPQDPYRHVTLDHQIEMPPEFAIEMSIPSRMGLMLKLLWGRHSLYSLKLTPGRVDTFLPDTLTAFAGRKPSFFSRIKQHVLFSKPVISLVNSQLRASHRSFNQVTAKSIYDLLPTHSETYPNIQNIVVTRDTVTIARVAVKHPWVDWVLSKHVLMSNYSDDVRFAGDMWKASDGTIHITPNSGTYTPSPDQLDAFCELLRSLFPGVTIVAEHRHD